MPRTPRRTATILLALAISLLAAACSSDASTRVAGASVGSDTTAAPVTVPATIPAGTTLRVGDQLDYLKTILSLSGEDRDFPYKVEYSAFVGGPPMLQAFQADAIDTGFVGSTPLIFAQAGRQEIKAVAGWASTKGSYGLLTAPGTDDIHGWADLKGKRVAFQQGTAAEAVLLEALDTAGLTYADITPVNLPIVQTASALQGGSADAGLLVEPLTSVYLGANPTAEQVVKANELTDRSAFVIAAKRALADPGTSAALGDYIGRLVRGFAYVGDHPEAIAEAVYVKQYHLSPERAAAIVKENGRSSFITLPGDVVKPQQRLADLFLKAGEIPSKLDVTAEFDTRYNAIVEKAARR